MKVLILASPRSGSTNLTQAISEILKLKKVYEPFNPNTNKDPFLFPDNSVTKIIAYDKPIEFYLDYISNFDRVIYLTRHNVEKAYESYIHAYIQHSNKSWHKKYTYNESLERDELRYNFVDTCSNIVKEVAKLNKKSYLIYEELYSKQLTQFNKAVDSIDLVIDKQYLRALLNPKYKLRQENKIKTIL